MSRMTRRGLLGAGLCAVPTLALGQVPAPQPVTVTVPVTTPDVSLALGRREARVVPVRTGCQHTGGGNIDVQQPTPDTIVVTMAGVAVAYGSPAGPATAALDFALNQEFDVVFDNPKVKTAKLCIEGRVIGFLRSHKTGSAEESGSAAVTGGTGPVLTADVLAHSVAGGQSLGVNDKIGPCCQVVPPGRYCLTQTFRVSASMPRVILPCKAPSAEFAPDPALNPLWISAKEPFHGARKGDLGYQIVVSVKPDVVEK